MKPSHVLSYFCSKTAIAEALKISPQAVQQWFDKDSIPIGRQFQLQVLTHEALKAETEPFCCAKTLEQLNTAQQKQ